MNKTMRSLIERIINEEYYRVQDLNFSGMDNLEKNEHDRMLEKTTELQDKLKGLLSEEQWKVFNEYIETDLQIFCLEMRYFFNRGVKAGLNNLSYIKEELGDLVIML